MVLKEVRWAALPAKGENGPVVVPAAAARDVGDLGQTSDDLIVLGLDAGQRAGAAADGEMSTEVIE